MRFWGYLRAEHNSGLPVFAPYQRMFIAATFVRVLRDVLLMYTKSTGLDISGILIWMRLISRHVFDIVRNIEAPIMMA